jgi:hypothetical protein
MRCRADTTGASNVALGVNSLYNDKTGSGNLAVGVGALGDVTASDNTALGTLALSKDTIGKGNVAIGSSAGAALSTGANNIDISNPGVAGDAGQIRIGTQGSQQAAFIAGVTGTTLPESGLPVLIDADGQLGTASPGPSGAQAHGTAQALGSSRTLGLRLTRTAAQVDQQKIEIGALQARVAQINALKTEVAQLRALIVHAH